MTSDESVDVDWAVILSRLEIVRAHCGDLCNTNKSITKERFERCIYVFTLFFPRCIFLNHYLPKK